MTTSQNHLRPTPPRTFIPLIPQKVTKATQADLNVSSSEQEPHTRELCTLWHLSRAYESLDIYT